MNNSRKKMLERIRAMMNTEGRTEAEMMAFLAKARELMATYEIDETELEEREEVKQHRSVISDPYEIKNGLCVPVGRFTRCRGYDASSKGHYGITFIGLESDVIFAKWLLDTLQRFVMRALREFQKQNTIAGKGNSNHTSASFVVGCVARIAEKLKLLTPVEWNKNKDLIQAELDKKGIALVKGGANNRKVDQNSAKAGFAAGDHATFNRPVEAGGMKRLK